MVSLELTEKDKDWLRKNYPGLTLTSEDGIAILVGEFYFDAIYNNYRITDSYKVAIEFKASVVSELPAVRETGSRIKQVAKVKNIALADLHTYMDGTACLCVKPAEAQYFPDGFCIQKFIEELVVPFFYAQSYLEQNGTWPWETYSHGSLGWLEWYFEQQSAPSIVTTEFIQSLQSQGDWKRIRRALTRKDGPKSYRICFCGSSKSYWNCHRKAFRGLRKLATDTKSLGMKM